MKLKQALTTISVFFFPWEDRKIILDTDASGHEIGTVLSQILYKNVERGDYFSRVLNKTEKNYCVTRRELLAGGIIR